MLLNGKYKDRTFLQAEAIAVIVDGSWGLNRSRFLFVFSSITCDSDMEGCSLWESIKADSLTKCFIQTLSTQCGL